MNLRQKERGKLRSQGQCETLRAVKTRGGTVNDSRFTPPASICFCTMVMICSPQKAQPPVISKKDPE